jgi:hypothetical protein
MELTRRSLDLINKEHVLTLAAIKEASCRVALPKCDDDCTTWLQYKVPCQHTILDSIAAEDGKLRPLTVQDVDKRWLSDSRVDQNHPYLRIQDPPAAESRCGRPRSIPIMLQALPRQLHRCMQRRRRREGRQLQDPSLEFRGITQLHQIQDSIRFQIASAFRLHQLSDPIFFYEYRQP